MPDDMQSLIDTFNAVQAEQMERARAIIHLSQRGHGVYFGGTNLKPELTGETADEPYKGDGERRLASLFGHAWMPYTAPQMQTRKDRT